MTVPERVEGYVRDSHADVVAGVVDSADAVADRWDGPAVADRERVVGALAAELRRRDLLARFPAVLAGAVEAAGYELPARPVAAPPYVVVTSQGPVLRATVADGRLVVRFRVFAVERGDRPAYVRAEGDPLTVALRR